MIRCRRAIDAVDQIEEAGIDGDGLQLAMLWRYFQRMDLR